MTAAEGTTNVEQIYVSDEQFGGHMLICVGFNRSVVDLAIHPDNEEFILINEGRPQKPLVLVIALHREPDLQHLISNGELAEGDIWALEMAFNDPRLSFFTMNAFTPHCEWTIPDPGPANIFFVTEPSQLGMRRIDMCDYAVHIEYDTRA